MGLLSSPLNLGRVGLVGVVRCLGLGLLGMLHRLHRSGGSAGKPDGGETIRRLVSNPGPRLIWILARNAASDGHCCQLSTATADRGRGHFVGPGARLPVVPCCGTIAVATGGDHARSADFAGGCQPGRLCDALSGNGLRRRGLSRSDQCRCLSNLGEGKRIHWKHNDPRLCPAEGGRDDQGCGRARISKCSVAVMLRALAVSQHRDRRPRLSSAARPTRHTRPGRRSKYLSPAKITTFAFCAWGQASRRRVLYPRTRSFSSSGSA
jgi:hypothetical protein